MGELTGQWRDEQGRVREQASEHACMLVQKWVQWCWGGGQGSVRGEGGSDRQQRVRAASVHEQEGDQRVGANRCSAWVAGVCCSMAHTLHNNRVDGGGQTSRLGK